MIGTSFPWGWCPYLDLPIIRIELLYTSGFTSQFSLGARLSLSYNRLIFGKATLFMIIFLRHIWSCPRLVFEWLFIPLHLQISFSNSAWHFLSFPSHGEISGYFHSQLIAVWKGKVERNGNHRGLTVIMIRIKTISGHIQSRMFSSCRAQYHQFKLMASWFLGCRRFRSRAYIFYSVKGSPKACHSRRLCLTFRRMC